MEISSNEKSKLIKAAAILMIVASVYFLVKTVSEVKGYRFIGGGATAASTVSFSGEGEVFAIPDIAMVNLTIREEAKTVAEAQSKVTAKEKAVLDSLAEQGVEKKDIKTESYNSYPKYDYGRPCYGMMPCSSTPTLIGYEVTESISVKVRDLEKTGTIIQGLGTAGVSELSKPEFTIENEDELKAQARKMAIDEAKSKAEVLADDLGVRLVRIVNFTEDGSYPMPLYAKAEMMAQDSAANAARPPELPTGENKITSSVVITYEIR